MSFEKLIKASFICFAIFRLFSLIYFFYSNFKSIRSKSSYSKANEAIHIVHPLSAKAKNALNFKIKNKEKYQRNVKTEAQGANSKRNQNFSEGIKSYKINEVKKGEKMLNDISINQKLIMKKIIGK